MENLEYKVRGDWKIYLLLHKNNNSIIGER
jgi:hypothetical protein